MKNVKIIFGIALIAVAIIFASCGDPQDETFLVQFDSNGGSLVDSQTVDKDGKAKEPTDPTPINVVPTAEGLYPAFIFDGWLLDGEDFDFSTPITKDITLTASWRANNLVTSADLITASFSYLATASDGTYTLALGSDKSVSATQSLTKNNVKLIIIGIGSERKITKTGAGSLFVFGISSGSTTANPNPPATGIELRLGKNITLVGNTSIGDSLVNMRNGSLLTMLDGSKITGSSSSGATGTAGWGSAVHIDWSRFVMEGGSITGNAATTTSDGGIGGVYVEDRGIVTLKGGSITGNNGTTKDFYLVGSSTLTLEGNATVGDLSLSIAQSSTAAYISVAVTPAFSGTVGALNLIGVGSNWVTVANSRILRPVSDSDSLTDDLIAKFTLGKFIPSNTPISNNYKIGIDGKLVAK